MGLTVDTDIDSETDLFGKTVDDLQENVVVGDDCITVALAYISD